MNIEGLLNSDIHLPDGSTTTLHSHLPTSRFHLILFIRHFGCIGCSVTMEQLSPRIQEIKKLGGSISIIGNGAPSFISGFLERYRLDPNSIFVATDPSLKIYQAAQLHRKWYRTFGPNSVIQFILSALNGHQQNSVQGDNFQLGGTLLLSSSYELEHHYQNQYITDSLHIEQLFSHMHRLVLKDNA